ncbi:class I SAM-dependent methyltransferase [Micromonospora sp. WMMD708]|uniref:class I SAM-dependent methyltransferase n=1 Tax=Micromonospora sp. WMMD708 TaxID=3403464 RepID=UPI003BF58F7B
MLVLLSRFGSARTFVLKRLERDALFHTLAARGQFTGRMLDVGTATGRYPMLFARAGWRSVGLDVADAAVAMAREELRRSDITDRVELVCGDIRTVTFPDQSFDLVTFMMGTFAHIPDVERQPVGDRTRAGRAGAGGPPPDRDRCTQPRRCRQGAKESPCRPAMTARRGCWSTRPCWTRSPAP